MLDLCLVAWKKTGAETQKHQRHPVGRLGALLSLSPLLIFSAFPSHAEES